MWHLRRIKPLGKKLPDLQFQLYIHQIARAKGNDTTLLIAGTKPLTFGSKLLIKVQFDDHYSTAHPFTQYNGTPPSPHKYLKWTYGISWENSFNNQQFTLSWPTCLIIKCQCKGKFLNGHSQDHISKLLNADKCSGIPSTGFKTVEWDVKPH